MLAFASESRGEKTVERMHYEDIRLLQRYSADDDHEVQRIVLQARNALGRRR
jgi:uncharacterized protein (DUF302 family)